MDATRALLDELMGEDRNGDRQKCGVHVCVLGPGFCHVLLQSLHLLLDKWCFYMPRLSWAYLTAGHRFDASMFGRAG